MRRTDVFYAARLHVGSCKEIIIIHRYAPKINSHNFKFEFPMPKLIEIRCFWDETTVRPGEHGFKIKISFYVLSANKLGTRILACM